MLDNGGNGGNEPPFLFSLYEIYSSCLEKWTFVSPQYWNFVDVTTHSIMYVVQYTISYT